MPKKSPTHLNPKSKSQSPKRLRFTSRTARAITIGQVIISILTVAAFLGANIYLEKTAVAERSINYLVKDYYENYFYDHFLNGRIVSPALFQNYQDKGFPQTSLRQLLTFDNSRHADRHHDFDHCDKKGTYVTITPVPPFTKTDYTYTVTLDCDTE